MSLSDLLLYSLNARVLDGVAGDVLLRDEVARERGLVGVVPKFSLQGQAGQGRGLLVRTAGALLQHVVAQLQVQQVAALTVSEQTGNSVYYSEVMLSGFTLTIGK